MPNNSLQYCTYNRLLSSYKRLMCQSVWLTVQQAEKIVIVTLVLCFIWNLSKVSCFTGLLTGIFLTGNMNAGNFNVH